MKTVTGHTPDIDWDLQRRIWGFSILGDVCERDAVIAERGDLVNGGLWDQTKRDLARSAIDRGQGWESAPDWWAFHHLPMEWRERAHNDGNACES